MMENTIKKLLSIFVLGCLAFLWNHWWKKLLLDKKCKPAISTKDGKKLINLVACSHADADKISDEYAKKQDRLLAENQEFVQYDLDPYKNPFLVTPLGNFDQKIAYNDKIEHYRRELLVKNKRMCKSEILRKRFYSLQLVISNTGTAPCGRMKVSLSFSHPCAYPATLMEKHIGSCMNKPQIPNERYNNSGQYVIGSRSEYEYYDIANIAPIITPICFSTADLLQKDKIESQDLHFYIDTEKAIDLVVSWEIIEETLGKNPIKGELKIRIEDNK